jgi:hypothetical protein
MSDDGIGTGVKGGNVVTGLDVMLPDDDTFADEEADEPADVRELVPDGAGLVTEDILSALIKDYVPRCIVYYNVQLLKVAGIGDPFDGDERPVSTSVRETTEGAGESAVTSASATEVQTARAMRSRRAIHFTPGNGRLCPKVAAFRAAVGVHYCN